VNVFFIPELEVGYGVVADLTDEGVVVSGALGKELYNPYS
jgi:hypothetical protein